MDIQLLPGPIHFSSKKKSTLEDYIKIYDDVISQEVCDNIISEYIGSKEWELGQIGNKNGGYVTNSTFRSCHVINMSTKESVDINYKTRKYFDTIIFEKAGNIVSKYIKDTGCEFLKYINTDSGYDLLRYKKGEFYKQHTDSGKTLRSISMSFNLNDDYEGGEFAFFDRELTFKLNKGSVIVFPSNFMYPHEILPITNGTRYSIVTWFH
jgi:hypothetical protein